MQEKQIETFFRDRVKEMGGLALKLISPGMSGLPDRLVLLPGGQLFFAELKRPGGKARPLQQAVHRRLDQLGFVVHVIDTKEMALEVLNRYEIHSA